MKTLRTIAPAILSVLAVTATSSVKAQAVVDTLDNGNLSVTGMTSGSGCTVLFSPEGDLLQNGRSCSSSEIRKAQSALDRYLREQGTSDRYSDDPSSQNLTLICYGEGRRPTVESRSEYEWNDRRNRYEYRNRIESATKEFDSEVQVDIRGTEGKIHLTGDLIAPLHSGGDNGWWSLYDLKVTSDEITGRYRMNALNKPRVRIDRRSGRIAIEGGTPFRGSCDAGNWGGSRNRF